MSNLIWNIFCEQQANGDQIPPWPSGGGGGGGGGHGLEGKIRVRAFYKCQLHFWQM